MKCISCKAPISPAFVHSLQANICPACGGELMTEATRDFIDEIKEAFEKMPANPEGLAGWLLSHYELVKIGTGEPVGQFYGNRGPAQPQQQGMPIGDGSVEDQLRNRPKIAQNKMQQFYKQAGINGPVKNPNQQKSAAQLAALAQQIQNDEDVGGFAGQADESMDSEFTQQALSAMSATDHGGGAITQEDKAAMQALMNAQQGNHQGNDMSDLPPALQQDRMDRLQKQQDLSLGGSVGKITRSS